MDGPAQRRVASPRGSPRRSSASPGPPLHSGPTLPTGGTAPLVWRQTAAGPPYTDKGPTRLEPAEPLASRAASGELWPDCGRKRNEKCGKRFPDRPADMAIPKNGRTTHEKYTAEKEQLSSTAWGEQGDRTKRLRGLKDPQATCFRESGAFRASRAKYTSFRPSKPCAELDSVLM